MNGNKPAFGHTRTGKVVLARLIESTDAGNPGFEPDVNGHADPTDWVPGSVSEDGRYHPDDPVKMPLSGAWVVTMDSLFESTERSAS
jgi:hypothetical protein